MNPQAYIDGLESKNRLLSAKNDELLVLSEKKAQAERDYNIQYAVAILRLKTDGHPSTLIPHLIKGDKIVSDLKYKFDVSEGVYKACQEAIKDIRTAIDTYRSLLTWLREEKRG